MEDELEDKPMLELWHEFFVPGIPRPQGSKNGFKRGGRIIMVESSKYVDSWRKQISDVARSNHVEVWKGPVQIRLGFQHAMPKSKYLRKGMNPHKVTRPDLDKLCRAVLDALTGIAYEDDSQVTRILAWKCFGEPGVQIGLYGV